MRHVLRTHHLDLGDVRAGFPGTNPVFLVGGRVVKFFAPYHEGARSHAIERDLGHLLGGSTLPVPRLEAQGELFPDGEGWPWPYLVTRAVPGVAYREVDPRLEHAARKEVARFAGRILRRLHEVPPASPVLKHSADEFPRFLRQRSLVCGEEHLRRQVLPRHLVRQIPGYLPAPRELVGRQGLRLLHGDLNGDHVLLEQHGDRWRPTGVIDFGDARMGEPLYELAAVHLGLFASDKRLLGAFLEAYGADAELLHDLPRRAMALALVHSFDVLGPVFRTFPELALTATLEGVARRLFDLDTPGLRGELAA